ncbi:MAG: hypothetical protein QM778_17720 [Myxococcales bacterium]
MFFESLFGCAPQGALDGSSVSSTRATIVANDFVRLFWIENSVHRCMRHNGCCANVDTRKKAILPRKIVRKGDVSAVSKRAWSARVSFEFLAGRRAASTATTMLLPAHLPAP